jgi:hypothetical protein
MPTFIKPGFWNKKRKQLPGELDLDRLIQNNSSSLNYKSYVGSISVISDGGVGSLLSVTTHENNLGANLTWTFGPLNKSIICTAASPVLTAGKTWTTTNDFFAKGNLSVIPSIQSTNSINYSFWFDGDAFGVSYDPGITDMFIEIRVYN